MYIFTTELKFEIYVQQRRFGKILFPVLDGAMPNACPNWMKCCHALKSLKGNWLQKSRSVKCQTLQRSCSLPIRTALVTRNRVSGRKNRQKAKSRTVVRTRRILTLHPTHFRQFRIQESDIFEGRRFSKERT